MMESWTSHQSPADAQRMPSEVLLAQSPLHRPPTPLPLSLEACRTCHYSNSSPTPRISRTKLSLSRRKWFILCSKRSGWFNSSCNSRSGSPGRLLCHYSSNSFWLSNLERAHQNQDKAPVLLS